MNAESDDEDEERPGHQSGVPDWTRFFPYDDPYPEQKDAIGPIQATIDAGGFVELEGACGTGKTLIAILSGITKVRDPSSNIQRVLVLTNVKQQIQIFEEDIRSINAKLPEDIDPISSITMVSKPDLCSYVDAGVIDHEDLYGKCDELRETVRNQADEAPTHPMPVFEDLANEVEVSSQGSLEPLFTDDWTAPYEPEIPELADSTAEYCPFFARFYADQFRDNYQPYTPAGVATREDILRSQSERGVCPHARMAESITETEVVIGNYQHVFDERTVEALTYDILSEETFVVADEAHNLVARARDELSDSVSYRTVVEAIAEIENYILDSTGFIEETVWTNLNQADVSETDVTRLLTFLEAFRDQFKSFVVDTLDQESTSWHERPDSLPDSISKTLGHPEENKQDKLSVWGELSDVSDVWSETDEFANPIVAVLEDLSNRTDVNLNTVSTRSVQRVLTNWQERDNVQYFRQLEINRMERDFESREGFSKYFSASLKLQNTIPRSEIAERLNWFGSGLLMSATLEPFDVFEAETGLEILATKHDRPVESLSYGLSFPRENRLSLHLPLQKFTYSNRGPPDAGGRPTHQAELRNRYEKAIVTTAVETPGNVLIAMPSYAEATWAARVLDEAASVNKEILLDESSSNTVTQKLKQEFFHGDAKVLVTGLHGTLTEGVDYAGDRLNAALIVGLPIKSTRSDYASAQEFAYEQAFGQQLGFTYAFQIPAVRKARQAYGRVIRGKDEQGVRVLADERYGYAGRWDGVKNQMPGYEQEEFTEISLSDHETRLREFWN